jgi:hypothetical protein
MISSALSANGSPMSTTTDAWPVAAIAQNRWVTREERERLRAAVDAAARKRSRTAARAELRAGECYGCGTSWSQPRADCEACRARARRAQRSANAR